MDHICKHFLGDYIIRGVDLGIFRIQICVYIASDPTQIHLKKMYLADYVCLRQLLHYKTIIKIA